MKIVHFFGYGANRSSNRIANILNKTPQKSYSAILEGYDLGIQKLSDMLSEVQEMMLPVWGPTFRSYTIRKGKGLVLGTIWELEEKDFEEIKNWELIPIWRELAIVTVKKYDGTEIEAITEKAFDDAVLSEIVDGLTYEENLNKKPTEEISPVIDTDEYKIKELQKVRQELQKISPR